MFPILFVQVRVDSLRSLYLFTLVVYQVVDSFKVLSSWNDNIVRSIEQGLDRLSRVLIDRVDFYTSILIWSLAFNQNYWIKANKNFKLIRTNFKSNNWNLSFLYESSFSLSDPRYNIIFPYSFLSQYGLIQSCITENQRIIGFKKNVGKPKISRFPSFLYESSFSPSNPRYNITFLHSFLS